MKCGNCGHHEVFKGEDGRCLWRFYALDSLAHTTCGCICSPISWEEILEHIAERSINEEEYA